VGKARDQPIAVRLEQHWADCRNPILRLWIAAKAKDLLFAYKVIDNEYLIDKHEKYYIRKFQPVTNTLRYPQPY